MCWLQEVYQHHHRRAHGEHSELCKSVCVAARTSVTSERCRRMRSWDRVRASILTSSLCVMTACALTADKSATPQDILECETLSNALLKEHDFPMSAVPRLTVQGKKAVYAGSNRGTPSSRTSTRVSISMACSTMRSMERFLRPCDAQRVLGSSRSS
jgi:hypothetical protein